MIALGLSQTVGVGSFMGEAVFGSRSFKSIQLFTPDDNQEVFLMIQKANLNACPLRFIPEIRFDNASDEFFFKDTSGMDPTKKASQFLIAAVYTF